MNTHILCRQIFHSSRLLGREARLCNEQPGLERHLPNAEAALKASGDIVGNEHLRDAMEQYRAVMDLHFREEMSNPVDRANFFALLLRGMMRNVPAALSGRPNYRDATNRAAIWVADPFQLHGQRLLSDPARDAFFDTQNMWATRPGHRMRLDVIRRNINEYIQRRDRLNNVILRPRNIAIPTGMSIDNPGALVALTRNEHFELLCVMITRSTELEDRLTLAASAGVPQLREFLAQLDGPMRVQINMANVIRADVTFQNMGPTEALTRFGIVLGPYLRQQYLQERTRPGSNGGPDASLWEERPMLAHSFLMRTRFPDLTGNNHFLEALRFHFDPRSDRNPTLMHGMSRGDVQSILSLITQSLMVSDQFLAKSIQQRTELRSRVNVGQQIEKTGAEVWNYVRNFQDHPVGAAVVGLTGFLAAKWLYNQIFNNEHWNITNYLGYGAIGGLAVGLFQQHRTGTAWWTDLTTAVDRMRDAELRLDPRDRTVSGYWARECNLPDARHRFCLSVLEEQPIVAVMNWYRQKAVNPAAPRPLPFNLGQYRNLFGQLPPLEIERLFYESLRAFFEHRGRAVSSGGWRLNADAGSEKRQAELQAATKAYTSAQAAFEKAEKPAGAVVPVQIRRDRDDALARLDIARAQNPVAVGPGDVAPDYAAIGEDYIRRMFVERRYFRYLASRMVEPHAAGTGADALLDSLDDADVRRRLQLQMGVEMFQRLMVYRYIYRQEAATMPTNNWQMYYVFALQMDEGAALRMGAPAGTFSQLNGLGQRVSDWFSSFRIPGSLVESNAPEDPVRPVTEESVKKRIADEGAAKTAAAETLTKRRGELDIANKALIEADAAVKAGGPADAKLRTAATAARNRVELLQAQTRVSAVDVSMRGFGEEAAAAQSRMLPLRRTLNETTAKVEAELAALRVGSPLDAINKLRTSEEEARKALFAEQRTLHIAETAVLARAAELAHANANEALVQARHSRDAARLAHTEAAARGVPAPAADELAKLLQARDSEQAAFVKAEEAVKKALTERDMRFRQANGARIPSGGGPPAPGTLFAPLP